MERKSTKPYKQCLAFGSNPGRFLCERIYDAILCSPSPGTLASDRMTYGKGQYSHRPVAQAHTATEKQLLKTYLNTPPSRITIYS